MAEIGSGDKEPPPKKRKYGKKLKFETDHDDLRLPNGTIKLLRESLKALQDVPYCFNLIKIIKSNADDCFPFSRSYVQIERSSDKCMADRKTVYDFACIFIKGIEVLNRFLNNPKKVQTEKEVKIALQRLVQTIWKLEDIGERLAKKISCSDKIKKKRETEWCITLANHLLKELSVNQQYRLDMQSKFRVDTCSCCSEPVYYDDCSLGNAKVWHGNVDIIMGPHPEILVHASGDPSDADGEGSLSSFEVKDDTTLSNNIPQIISETIVFAFLQKKENPSFKNYLIPTAGISKKDILFYFYDPEYDILLESAPFKIFESSWEDGTISFPTILALWFVLNYKTFCTGITEAMIERKFTADFLLGLNTEIKSIYMDELQFRLGGTVLARPGYRFTPQPGEGWETKKSKPVKRYINE